MDARDAPPLLSSNGTVHSSLDSSPSSQQTSLSPLPPAPPSFSGSHTFDQVQEQKQSAMLNQPQQTSTSGNMSTPEAHWSASSNFSSAPELTLSSSEALDNGSFFDSINRPYTPSYNSASGFEGAFSEQEDFWSGTGSQIDGTGFDFGQEISKSQGSGATLAYDPETADNYNNLQSILLAAHSFGNSSSSSQQQQQQQTTSDQSNKGGTGLPTLKFSDQNSFREPLEKSPLGSPQLGASSPFHTRNSSFGSNIGSPTQALDFEQTWMQSLGQRMNLGEDDGNGARSRSSIHRQSLSLHNYSGQNHFAPVFEEEQTGQENQTNYASHQPFLSYTYSPQQQPSGSTFADDVRQQSVGDSQLPILSISDTTMQDAAFQPASSKTMEGRSWTDAGNWTQAQNEYYPLSYSNAGQTNVAGMMNSNATTPDSLLINSRPMNNMDGGSQAKRQDSYDQIRKFLRLDVDMGFMSQQDQAEQIDVPVRKRSNSDFGPSYFGAKEGETVGASPPLFTVVPGGVNDKTPIALTSGVNWATELAQQRKLQAQMQGDLRHDPVVMTMQQNNHTMDPHLLFQQQQQSQQQVGQNARLYDPASGPIRQRDVSNLRGAAGPYQHNRTSSSGASNATPWLPISPTVPPTIPNNDLSYATLDSPSRRAQAAASLRRSQSASRHRRGAQSEDLSQLARSSNPAEFLNRITAPDGSLAPPNSHPSLSTFQGTTPFTNVTGVPSRVHPPLYRTSHDRHQSGSSNQSTASSVGSNEEERNSGLSRFRSSSTTGNNTLISRPGQKHYSQTASPTYTSLSNAAFGDPILSNAAGPSNGNFTSFPYPVAQVTTTATQAASASRRKNEAIHICPIPGCGSTFTRKFNLNGHIRSHTGARPYECREPGCGKSFARSFDLSRHEKLHAGIKPHNCESCGKSFARADALSRHLRNDAGNGGCAQRFNEEGEEEGDSTLNVITTTNSSTPFTRLRSGSSASSSLESVDGMDSRRQVEQNQLQIDRDANTTTAVKREQRFKGYIL